MSDGHREFGSNVEQDALIGGLLEFSSQPFGIGYVDGRLGMVNRAFEELTGYTREELENIDWSCTLTPPEFQEMEQEKLKELQRTGEPVRYEKEYIRKDGTRVPIELLVHLITDEDGTPKYYYSFITDITERKRTEKAIKENEEKFSKAFHSNSTAMTVTRVSDGMIVDANESFERLFGYTHEETEGHTTNELGIWLTPQERDAEVERLLRDGKIPMHEVIFGTKSSHHIHTMFSVELITINSRNYILSTIMDISERKKAEEALKESEEKYRHLVQYVPTAIYEIDFRGPRFKSVNDALSQLSGYSREELLSMNPFDILDSKSRELFQERIRKGLTGDKIEETVDYKVIHKDGRKLWVTLNIKPNNSDGKIDGALVVGHDITERKQTEEALRDSEERYRNIIDNVQDAYIQADKNGTIIMLSPSAARMYGYSPEEMIGIPALSLYKYPEDRNKLLEELRNHGKVEDFESEALRKDGTTFIVSLNAQLHYKQGQIQGTEAFVRDISERKEREMLSDALNKVNSYINSTLDYDEIMQLIVEEGAKALGSESSVINLREGDKWVVKSVYNFPNNIIGQLKSDKESPTSVFVANKKEAVAFNDAQNDSRVSRNGMKLHGVASVLVAPIILKDEVKGIIAFYHHQKPVVFTEAQIDFANKLSFSLSQAVENAQLFEDIKRSEERYHSLYSSMSEGVALHEIIYNSQQKAVDYIIIDINPAYEHIIGLKRNEVVGKKGSELYGTGNPPYIEVYAPVAESGAPTEFETYFEPMNKTLRISVMSPGKGKFATVFEDITERKQAEEALSKSESSLAEAQRIGHIGSWEWNVQTGEVRWSEELYNIYRVDSEEFTPTIDSFAKYIHPDDQ